MSTNHSSFLRSRLAIVAVVLLLGLVRVVESWSVPTLSSEYQGSSSKLLILGLGRTALEVANLVSRSGDDGPLVVGTVRTPKEPNNKDDDDEGEVRRILFDPLVVRDHLVDCDRVLFTIPLSRDTDPTMEAVLSELQQWWDTDDHPKVLGILSTTGVYGNHDGRVVTEDSELLCGETSNAHLYKEFEDRWTTIPNNDNDQKVRRLCIFRCAGIYDSSRSALHTVYNQWKDTGRMPTTTTQQPNGNKTNRIHAVDLARGVVEGLFSSSSSCKESTTRIYNLADNHPESRSVVLAYAVELLRSIGIVEDDTTDKTTAGEPSRSSQTRQRRRERESKLISNQRMIEELLSNDGLVYPTYKEGLDAIFEDPTTPWRIQQ